MTQIFYAMRFKGKAGPGGSSNVMKVATSSPSTTITSGVNQEFLYSNIASITGENTEFESEVTLTGDTSFLEKGTIRFGRRNNIVRFSTVGQGFLGDSVEPKLKSGTVMWRIDGGEGQFLGASGYITSNFTLSDVGDVTDYQFGLIFVK
jgi:hypothetical protein